MSGTYPPLAIAREGLALATQEIARICARDAGRLATFELADSPEDALADLRRAVEARDAEPVLGEFLDRLMRRVFRYAGGTACHVDGDGAAIMTPGRLAARQALRQAGGRLDRVDAHRLASVIFRYLPTGVRA